MSPITLAAKGAYHIVPISSCHSEILSGRNSQELPSHAPFRFNCLSKPLVVQEQHSSLYLSNFPGLDPYKQLQCVKNVGRGHYIPIVTRSYSPRIFNDRSLYVVLFGIIDDQ